MDTRHLTADELFRLRMQREWTQAQVAQSVGLSRFTISRYESGTEPMSLAISLALRMVLERSGETKGNP